MTDAVSPATPPAARSTAAAFLLALPAIGLMTLILWTFVLATAFSLSVLIDLELLGVGLVGALLAGPTLWANWHAIRLSVNAERHPHEWATTQAE